MPLAKDDHDGAIAKNLTFNSYSTAGLIKLHDHAAFTLSEAS
jgi:hypothetical protein